MAFKIKLEQKADKKLTPSRVMVEKTNKASGAPTPLVMIGNHALVMNASELLDLLEALESARPELNQWLQQSLGMGYKLAVSGGKDKED